MFTIVGNAEGSTQAGTDKAATNKYRQPMTFTIRQPTEDSCELVITDWRDKWRGPTVYNLTREQVFLLAEQLVRAVTGWPR